MGCNWLNWSAFDWVVLGSACRFGLATLALVWLGYSLLATPPLNCARMPQAGLG